MVLKIYLLLCFVVALSLFLRQGHARQPRLSLNARSSCLSLMSAWITAVR
jgi:hypothetical protein